jgi:LysM repeat protein
MKRIAALFAVIAVVTTACLGSGGDKATTTDPVSTLGALDTILDVDTNTTVDPFASTTVDPSNPTLATTITTVPLGTGSTVPAPPTTVAAAGGAVDSGQTYTVVSNDNLRKIATSLGVTLADLQALNGITDPDKIRSGQKLKVPTKRPATTTTKASATATTKAGATGNTYTVKSGENLTKIAKDLGVTLTAMMTANNITDPDKIRAGQVLTVPAKTAATTATTKAGATTATTAAATTVAATATTVAATTATTVAATTTKATSP